MKDLLIAARPANGFRRAGVFHPASEVRHGAGTFTPEQVQALLAEPNLIVVEADRDEPAAKGNRAKGGKAAAADDSQPENPAG